MRWLNPAAQRLLGDVRGRQFTSVIAPEDKAGARERFAQKMLGTSLASEATGHLVSSTGTRVPVEVSAVALTDGDRVVGVFGLIEDRPDDSATAPPPHLTPRQVEVLRLLEQGRSTKQIAAELHLEHRNSQKPRPEAPESPRRQHPTRSRRRRPAVDVPRSERATGVRPQSDTCTHTPTSSGSAGGPSRTSSRRSAPSRRGPKRVSLAARISSIRPPANRRHSFRLELRPAEPRRGSKDGRGRGRTALAEDRTTRAAGSRDLESRCTIRRPPPRARPPRPARAGRPPRASLPAPRPPPTVVQTSTPSRYANRVSKTRPRRPARSPGRPRGLAGRSRHELRSARNQRQPLLPRHGRVRGRRGRQHEEQRLGEPQLLEAVRRTAAERAAVGLLADEADRPRRSSTARRSSRSALPAKSPFRRSDEPRVVRGRRS